jgi:hypothetical protein
MQDETTLRRKYERTNIFIIDPELWAWAQYQAKLKDKESVSEYIFDLIKADKEKASTAEV